MNKYPRLISWEYHNAYSNLKEDITEVYILDERGEEEIKDGTLTNYKEIFKRPNKYFRINTKEGFTKKAKKYKYMYLKMKEQYPDLEKKIKPYNKILKDCGSYIYMNLSFMDIMSSSSFYSQNKEYFLENPNYVKKECFTIEFIEKLLNYTPYSLFGGEITDYQKIEVPKLLLALKLNFPEIHSKLSRKSEQDIRENFLNKFEKLTMLKPGKVGKIKGEIFLPNLWEYDGEYLKSTEKKKNLDIEYKIKANDSIEVEIIDIDTVDLDKMQ